MAVPAVSPHCCFMAASLPNIPGLVKRRTKVSRPNPRAKTPRVRLTGSIGSHLTEDSAPDTVGLAVRISAGESSYQCCHLQVAAVAERLSHPCTVWHCPH